MRKETIFEKEKNSNKIEAYHERMKKVKLWPLRIDARTVIYVPYKKRNKKYAEQYRERLKKSADNWGR